MVSVGERIIGEKVNKKRHCKLGLESKTKGRQLLKDKKKVPKMTASEDSFNSSVSFEIERTSSFSSLIKVSYLILFKNTQIFLLFLGISRLFIYNNALPLQ